MNKGSWSSWEDLTHAMIPRPLSPEEIERNEQD